MNTKDFRDIDEQDPRKTWKTNATKKVDEEVDKLFWKE